MRIVSGFLVAAIALLPGCVMTTVEGPQGSMTDDPATIGEAPLYAIGVVTPDLGETVSQYQRVLGAIPQSFGEGATNDDPSGGKVGLSMAVVFLPDFYIKLQQPVGERGPYSAHASEYGLSIMNFQMKVNDAQAVRARLERIGGKWTLGAPGDFWAYVDMNDALGVTLEPINVLNKFPAAPDPETKRPLAAMPVTRIGIAVDDVEETSKRFADAFQIQIPDVRNVDDFTCVDGTRSLPVPLRMASWRQGDVWIDLVESQGSTPWRQLVEKRGKSAAISIGFDAGEHFEEVLNDLQTKGGRVLCQNRDRTVAYVDFMETLGLVVEVDANAAGIAD